VSKQAKPIRHLVLCQSRQQCYREATWGTYNWQPGQTDVDLGRPVRVFCGPHKPRFDIRAGDHRRNVKLLRA